MLYILTIVLCVIADQALKAYVAAQLSIGQSMPLLPGVVEMLHVRNTGGGFSILSGHTRLLAAVTAVLLVGVAYLLVKKTFPRPLAMWSMVLVLGGGLGNLIDRVRLGYVVDMFHLQFFPSYPVFNLADILVVCGVVGFAVHYVFFHGKMDQPDRGAPDRGTEEDDGHDRPARGS